MLLTLIRGANVMVLRPSVPRVARSFTATAAHLCVALEPVLIALENAAGCLKGADFAVKDLILSSCTACSTETLEAEAE